MEPIASLQYASHANEMSLPIPEFPTLFLKPSTSLADPWPAPTVLPKITQVDNTGDYESEMVIVIGRDAKDVGEDNAMDYVLGYTAANDISSRTSQMNQSQWCFSKGFDTACPIGNRLPRNLIPRQVYINTSNIGPAIVSASHFPDVTKFTIRGLKNGRVVQNLCPLSYVIPAIQYHSSPLPRLMTTK